MSFSDTALIINYPVLKAIASNIVCDYTHVYDFPLIFSMLPNELISFIFYAHMLVYLLTPIFVSLFRYQLHAISKFTL